MRVVFMGTPAFAVPSLEALASHHDVVLAVSRPDAVSGRGGCAKPSEVKQAALRLGIPALECCAPLGDRLDDLGCVSPDVICVVAFGMLLPPEVLNLPRLGCLNVHASLLPRFRGAAPIQRAVLEGERATGVSIMRMDEGLDTGPYALQRTVVIGERYAEEIGRELATIGAQALIEVLEQASAGSISWTDQDDTLATYAAKVTKDDVALLPDITVREAFARVRAAGRSAPARACVGDRELTVVRARPGSAEVPRGRVSVTDGLPALGFADGSLLLEVVRPAGKPDMSAADWARGAHLPEGVAWRCTR
ncbi:MAG: methionyl-tRNA formyltransferase [Coriobacteriia bacterium]|nr:methionyl-tRNA formyltransferase [Coriobacteriia bacterium]